MKKNNNNAEISVNDLEKVQLSIFKKDKKIKYQRNNLDNLDGVFDDDDIGNNKYNDMFKK